VDSPWPLPKPEPRRCTVMDAHETIAVIALLTALQAGRTLGAIVSRRRPEEGEEPGEDSTPPEA
jgi:hypothetical protein